nr:MAG TPA: minor capsid protein [Microviridae sp.]
MSFGAIFGQIAGQVANKASDFLFSNYQANRAWARQKQAAQSAHQWEVADLKAAGLNPILSATGGNGANLPSVAVAQNANSEAPNIIGMMSALQGIRNQEQQENVLKAQEELLKTQADRERDSATLLRSQTAQINTNNYIPAVFNARLMADPKLRNQMVNMYQTERYKNALGQFGQLLGGVQQFGSLLFGGR